MDLTNKNTPRIETQRLILRKFTPEDAKALFLILSDQEANTFLPWFLFETLHETEQYLEEHYLKSYEKPTGCRYAICLKSDNLPIGYVNVSEDDSHDFGYGLRTAFWHQGIVTEACKAVVEWLCKSGIPYITATHDVHNPRSGEVMKKLGMDYKYSYEERVQPKNTVVIFRMCQLNFDGNTERTFQKYWNKYENHFIEKNI